MDGDNVFPPDARARQQMLWRAVQRVGTAQVGEETGSISCTPDMHVPADTSPAASLDYAQAKTPDDRTG